MKELMSTHDPVLISWVQATLSDAGIETAILDQYTPAGFISFLPPPRRVMVDDADFQRARWILDTAKTGAAP